MRQGERLRDHVVDQGCTSYAPVAVRRHIRSSAGTAGLASALKLPRNYNAVQFGYQNIRHKLVEVVLLQRFEGLHAVFGGDHLLVRIVGGAVDELPHGGIVFCNQKPGQDCLGFLRRSFKPYF